MDFRQWYTIFVLTGQEEKIKTRVEEKLSEHEGVKAQLFVPRVKLQNPPHLIREQGKPEEEERVMFPGYVLVGTDDIESVFKIADGVKGVLRFLKNDEEFQEVRLEEISRLVYMAGEEDVIGESEICLDENNRIVVLSGPLKGEEGNITKFNRRRSRVAVEFWIGTERREVWLGVRFCNGEISEEQG